MFETRRALAVRWTTGVLLLLLWTISSARADEAGTLGEFTGAKTRIVWVQDFSNASTDILALGQRLKLMGFDSSDDQGERPILAELRNYAKPLLTPDGQRVVFSDQQSQKFYVVNWDGTGKKLLGDGLAVDVWRDPADAVDWVYFARRVGKAENVTYRNLRRLKLTDPKTIQKVWDLTDVGCDNFQLAADGNRAAGEFPWPNGGVVDLRTRKWQKLDEGCWASIAPDASGVSWVFDGPHRHLQFHRPDQPSGWKVNINSAPNIQGAEVFHPRWSNHVRYFVMTGPYSVKGKVNMISGGGPQVEVYLGRFSPDFQSVEAWWPVTSNTRGDFYPDAWISGGESSVVELPGLQVQSPTVTAASWPPVADALLFAWNNGAQANQIAEAPGRSGRSCQITLHGRAFPGQFHDLSLQGGTATLEEISEPLLAACRTQSQVTIGMLMTPATLSKASFVQLAADSKPQLRLLQESDKLAWEWGSFRGRVEKPLFATQSPVHLTVTISPERLTIYADGKQVSSAAVEANFAPWKSVDISCGSPTWRGSIEAVTIHGKAQVVDDIAKNAASTRERLSQRKSLPRFRIEAKCRERSTVPDPQQILPYRRALSIHEFEVVKIDTAASDSALPGKKPVAATNASPDFKIGTRILVARWVILDGKVLVDANLPRVEETIEMHIEAIDDHPELKSERQIHDVEALDLPVYYEVSA